MMYVDSNYWIYWLDARFPEHKHTTSVMRRAVSRGVVLNYATLIEVAHYLRRLPGERFSDIMADMQNLSTLTLTDLDHETTHLALELLVRYSSKGLGGRDCVIIATMRIHGVKDLVTHDRAFSAVDGIRVVDTIPPTIR